MGARRLIIVAGCNGAGKSTLTQALRYPVKVIDPDAIAREASCPPVEAGRKALAMLTECIAAGESCIQETTLSGRGYLRHVRRAREKGFLFELHYIGLEDCRLAIERVRARVANGGHDIPPGDVCRRYARSMENLPDFLCLSDAAVLYDNSSRSEKYKPLVSLSNGALTYHANRESLPQWSLQALRRAGWAD